MKRTGMLLKISGEYFSDERKNSIFDAESVLKIVEVLRTIRRNTDEPLYIVVGGGNICRGRELQSFQFGNGAADRIGMFSTLQNAVLLKETLEKLNQHSRVFAPFAAGMIGIEEYKAEKARGLANDGAIIIFGAGLGRPGFTTDTASVACAYDTECTTVVKFSKVGGLFSRDPKKHADAQLIPLITFKQAINQRIEVMDPEAFILAERHAIKIKIIDLWDTAILRGDFINNLAAGSLVRKS